jgi:hypothetical protein
VSVLEWIFISELVLLATAGMFWMAGLAIGRDNPDDPFTAFYQTFWRVFLRRRGKLRAAVSALDEHIGAAVRPDEAIRLTSRVSRNCSATSWAIITSTSRRSPTPG